MGQGVLESLLQSSSIDAAVDSAGTYGGHRGEAPDRRAMLCMQNHGFDISIQRARKIEKGDFAEFDWILAMDKQVMKDLINLCPPEHQAKIYLFMDSCSPGDEVEDPWSGNMSDFEKAFQKIQEAAVQWIERWQLNYRSLNHL
jgi:protein-tyrosine phosphatase